MEKFASTPRSYPSPEAQELFQAILTITSVKEASEFFRDLLTMAEIKEFTNRWQIVKMVYAKKSYNEIAKTLHVSTATVTRVAYWLYYGMGGYKEASGRMYQTKFKDTYHEKPPLPHGKRWY